MILEYEELLKQDSKALAVTIVANRVLGSYREEAKKCMLILMQRRFAGDKFEFERFIEDAAKEYKIEVKMDFLDDLKTQITNSIAGELVRNIKK